MVLQQMVNSDYKNVPQQPAAIIKKVKKKKSSTIIIEDNVSDSSSDSLSVEVTNFVENVPIQRPIRCKAQRLNTNKYNNFTIKQQ